MTRLICVRHGPATTHGICYGRFEIDTIEPEPAVDKLRAFLTAATAERSTCLWSSPALRCRKVAAVLAKELGLLERVDECLAELSFGDWEGRPWNDLEGLPEFSHWMQNWQELAPPGGESLFDLRARTRDWCRGLRSTDVHVAVTHAGVIRQLMVLLRGLSWEEAIQTPAPHLTPFEFTVKDS